MSSVGDLMPDGDSCCNHTHRFTPFNGRVASSRRNGDRRATHMNIVQATHQYERWLAQHTTLVRPDLVLKHASMKRDAFSFLRATFYRWTQVWEDVCADLCGAPEVLAIGDLHVENFGTWRDDEGRLVWGLNDFDEAFPLPYTNDLVRLAVSA